MSRLKGVFGLSEDFDEKKFESEISGEADAKAEVAQIVDMFEKKGNTTLRGNEYINRMKKRAGSDVTDIAGHGKGAIGTSEYALQKLVERANEKGYNVHFRARGNTIEVLLVPKNKNYDSKKSWLDKENIPLKI